MANKAIFIGLGGAGVQAAGHVKARLIRSAESPTALAEDCRFLFLDTSSVEIDTINKLYRGLVNSGRLISQNEIVDLGDVNPLAVYSSAEEAEKDGTANPQQRRLLSFIDRQGSTQFRNQPLRDGASANRQQGRIAVWNHVRDIQVKISDALSILSNLKKETFDVDTTAFYILSGTCGGTGSSAFLDVAYLLDREYRRQHPGLGDPRVRAVLFMPHWYIEANRKQGVPPPTLNRYQANAHAFFDELDFFLEDYYASTESGRGEKFAAVAVSDEADQGITAADRLWPVLNFAVLVDSTTELESSLDNDQMYRNTAEMLYHWHLGGVKESLVANFDNVLTQNYANRRPVPAAVTMGYRAIEFPVDKLASYLEKRFAYEAFNYGVLGMTYDEALPDEQVRTAELERIFNDCIGRYLFTEHSVDGVPNLERERCVPLDRYLASFTASRFLDDGKGLVSSVSGMLRAIGSGASHSAVYSANRVRDPLELERLRSAAADVQRGIANEIRATFESDEEPTGRARLRRAMQVGVAGAETGARTGALEREIEDAVLRYGLVFARALASRLDVMAATRATALSEQRRRCRQAINDAEARIAELDRTCREGKDAQVLEAFPGLFAALQERIRQSTEEARLAQQITLLNDLSEGESGILDVYATRLGRLVDACRTRLDGGSRAASDARSLAKEYNEDLPKEFADTGNIVTTIYLPDLASFVGLDRWVDDHPFARIYEKLVEQVKAPGGHREPRRYGDDYGRHADVKGLHQALREMLTSDDVTGVSKGYERDGEIAYFRDFFGSSSFEPSKLVQQLESFVRSFIRLRAERSKDVAEELARPIVSRLEELDESERIHVNDRFSEARTQTFCAMSETSGEARAIYSIYAGTSEKLARKLGYEPGTRQQFLATSDTARLLKIKVRPLYPFSAYPKASQYRSVYLSAREAAADRQEPFTPHLHRVFNEHGVRNGIGLLAQQSPASVVRLMATTLFYREMLDAAQAAGSGLLEQLVHIDANLVGNKKTLHSPILVETSGGVKRALLCCNVVESNGRLRFERGEFVTLAGQLTSHKDLVDGLAANANAAAALSKVDAFIRQRGTRNWLGLFDDAAARLRTRLVPQATDGPELHQVYHDLKNAFEGAFVEIRALVSNREEVVTGSGAAPVERDI